jgi:hypothetical protein
MIDQIPCNNHYKYYDLDFLILNRTIFNFGRNSRYQYIEFPILPLFTQPYTCQMCIIIFIWSIFE